LKVLTSVRVGQKQKKLEIDIPKLPDFVHQVYIMVARRLYKNVFLFESGVMPLQQQKNMRECELIVKECILNVIRNNMPIETILRAYLDETVEDDVEEIREEVKEELEEIKPVEAKDAKEETVQEKDKDVQKVDSKENVEANDVKTDANVTHEIKEISEASAPTSPVAPAAPASPALSTKSINFNDTDNVVNYDTKGATTETTPEASTPISAPKTIERLEEISTMRNEQRKLEDAMDEEDDDDDKIQIMSDANVQLDSLDVQTLDKSLELNTDPLLDDVVVLQ
jgi:hypothetical protein